MIIIGYQGIGKSTLAGKDNCIDLESGNFWVDGKRAEDWYIPYCQIANHLSEQGYTVFVSSHEFVRNELKKSKEGVAVICPSVELRDEWVAKLEERYNHTGLKKDYKAWKNAEERYEENILEIVDDDFATFYIRGMNYNLKLIVLGLRGDLQVTDGYFDELVVQYEEFPDEDIKVLTVSKGNGLEGEALYMTYG